MPAVKLSPIYNEQTITITGDPASGYQLFTYAAGSSTPLASYTDVTGTVAQTNPIIINTNGLPTNGPIWLQVGLSYKFVLKDPLDNVIHTIDNITGVNDATSTANQWITSGVTPTFVTATSFTVPGDQTSEFHAGRRLQFTTTAGTVYGTIASSSFSVNTTVTMLMDFPSVLDSGLTTVNLSILRADKTAIPPALTISSINGGPLAGMRNRIINGEMRIDQRNVGVLTAGVNNAYAADRWRLNMLGGGTYNVQRVATAPAGFSNSLQLTVTAADASIAATDAYGFLQGIEGLNTNDLGFGTSSAATITLSFWVRSSVTGQYSGSLRNAALDRSYVFSYTINAANTFEYKTITIPGDTTGTWAVDTSAGIFVTFDLGSGTSFNGTSGAWQGGNFTRASSAVNWIATGAATFLMTGVQLETGTIATPFERIPHSFQHALSQRYFYKSFQQNIAPAQNTGSNSGAIVAIAIATGGNSLLASRDLPVTMRTTPTVITYNPTAANANWSANPNSPTATVIVVGEACVTVLGSGAATTIGSSHAIHIAASADF